MGKFHKQVGLNKEDSRKAVRNKRVWWKREDRVEKKYENANRVHSFIWHLRVVIKIFKKTHWAIKRGLLGGTFLGEVIGRNFPGRNYPSTFVSASFRLGRSAKFMASVNQRFVKV